MVEPHWTSYVGMISGLIGAITGIAGAIMGFLGYRKANSLKSLEMRLDLQRNATNLHSSYAELENLIDSANQSRIRIAAATGRFHSGMMVIWNNELETDKATIVQIGETIPTGNERYENLNTEELASRLVDAHRIQGQINQLMNKYNASIREDDNRRDHLREDVQTRIKTPP